MNWLQLFPLLSDLPIINFPSLANSDRFYSVYIQDKVTVVSPEGKRGGVLRKFTRTHEGPDAAEKALKDATRRYLRRKKKGYWELVLSQ